MVVERDATVTQLTAQLVRTVCVDVAVSGAVGQQCVACGDAVVDRRSVTEWWRSVMPL